MEKVFRKSDLREMPEFFDRYINKVEDIPVLEALQTYGEQILNLDQELLRSLGTRVYAEGKWTVKVMLQHMIDTERILTYRALRFARNDKTNLHGFDEESFGQFTDAENRTIEDLLDEFSIVRQASIILFKSFTEEMMYRSGEANNKRISVLALGFVVAGHPMHHLRILEERYFPLLNEIEE